MQELERGDSALRSFASVQGALVMYPIAAFGSEAQKAAWLPHLARGDKVGCFGLTEPDHGSDPAGMVTTAVRRGDRYVLNGSKLWITNGSIADVAVVWARTDEGVRGLLVEQYAKTRVQFGRPIAGFQLVQQKLVTMLVEITKAQLLCLRLGQLKGAGRADADLSGEDEQRGEGP